MHAHRMAYNQENHAMLSHLLGFDTTGFDHWFYVPKEYAVTNDAFFMNNDIKVDEPSGSTEYMAEYDAVNYRLMFMIPAPENRFEVLEYCLSGDIECVAHEEAYTGQFSSTIEAVRINLNQKIDWVSVLNHTYSGDDPAQWAECSNRSIEIC